MDVEEIEELYKKENEKAKKEYLEVLKNKRKTKESEAKYKDKLKNARIKYNETSCCSCWVADVIHTLVRPM